MGEWSRTRSPGGSPPGRGTRRERAGRGARAGARGCTGWPVPVPPEAGAEPFANPWYAAGAATNVKNQDILTYISDKS